MMTMRALLTQGGVWDKPLAPSVGGAAAGAGQWGAGSLVVVPDRSRFHARLALEDLMLMHTVRFLLSAVVPQQRPDALIQVEGIRLGLAGVVGEQNAR